MATKKTVKSVIQGLFVQSGAQAQIPQVVQQTAPVPNPLYPYTRNTAIPQMITTSTLRSGTLSGIATVNVGTVAADGFLSCVSGSMVEFGATMNTFAEARIEVTDGAGTLKFAIKMTIGAQGNHDSVCVAPQGVPVRAGDQVNIVSVLDQTTPALTKIYAYVCVTPYV